MTKILFADDDPDTREVVAIILESHGIDTVLAGDGDEALELARSNPDLDLILVDLVMPRLGGTEVIDRLKEDATLRQVPVVVLSGDAISPSDAERLGASACLLKPVDLGRLMGTIALFARSSHAGSG